MDAIIVTKKDDPEAFGRYCEQLGVEHPSTVHHFEVAHGYPAAVLWDEITPEVKIDKPREKVS